LRCARREWVWGVKTQPYQFSILVGFAAFFTIGSRGHAQSLPIATTREDFFQSGTQPQPNSPNFDPIITSFQCSFCHEVEREPPVFREVPIFNRWQGSMKANSARDPVFHAALAIANQDASFSGDLCIRCHAPGGWLAGRGVSPGDPPLKADDLDGVTCSFCHRMVDPVFRPGESPSPDRDILLALEKAGLLPSSPGGGNFVVDPQDTRRGPFDDVPVNRHGVPMYYSPFHTRSDICATCHDVSNPALVRAADGSYRLDQLNTPHPTQDKYDMFPLERTYSEWANSDYARIGVDARGVFGGNHPTGIMRTCQDCHMPLESTFGCIIQEDPFFIRDNVPAHNFNGGNAWTQDLLSILYSPEILPQPYLTASKRRAREMLGAAATVRLTKDSCSIQVRIENETGHKLPTGYSEGRRMWISVLFRDDNLNVIARRGHYNTMTAELTTLDTKVYEVIHGLDEAMSEMTGLPVGPSFHLVLNNKVLKDNRIPPRGFTNAAFAAVQAEPIGATYADEQYWDETAFRVPEGATAAIVTLSYQTASKEYIEFLSAENRNPAPNAGTELYELWELTDMSPPTKMYQMLIEDLTSGEAGDSDCDRDEDLADFAGLANCFTGPAASEASLVRLGCEAFDLDDDGDVDLDDHADLVVTLDGPG